MTPDLNRHYSVNDRPVTLVTTPDGGLDVLALDMRTGAFVADRSYFLRISEVGKDVDSLSPGEFEARVADIRAEILAKRLSQTIWWEVTGDGEYRYQIILDGHTHVIRINDFPAEPLYTLLVEGQPLADLEDWPPAWRK